MKDEALKLALEALEYWDVHGKLHQPTEEAITAIKQTLAAPVQEPCSKCHGLGYYDEGHENDDGSMSGGNYVDCEKCKPPTAPTQEHQINQLEKFKNHVLANADALGVVLDAPAAPVQEHAEQLAKLGWQYFECPACGSEGAKAFAKTPAAPEQQADQEIQALTSLGSKLALELECLLLEGNDTAATSKWWNSAQAALEDWRSYLWQVSHGENHVSPLGKD